MHRFIIGFIAVTLLVGTLLAGFGTNNAEGQSMPTPLPSGMPSMMPTGMPSGMPSSMPTTLPT